MPFDSIPRDSRADIVYNINALLPEMNIFCTYNVLWGFSRMNANEELLGSVLYENLFNKVVDILHTFLPSQYGDILWAMGSLGIFNYRYYL